jgi:type VI secretion system VasD/TssJ family lipoprotein
MFSQGVSAPAPRRLRAPLAFCVQNISQPAWSLVRFCERQYNSIQKVVSMLHSESAQRFYTVGQQLARLAPTGGPVRAVTFAVIGVLVGCGGSQKPACVVPTKVELVVRASRTLNVDDSGASLPTVVRWFQLEDAGKAHLLGFQEFWSDDSPEGSTTPPALGSVLASQEFQTFPGQSQTLSIPWNPRARVLVVAAVFRKPEGDRWREILLLEAPTSTISCPVTRIPIEMKGSALWTPNKKAVNRARPPESSKSSGANGKPASASKGNAYGTVASGKKAAPTSTRAPARPTGDLGLRFDTEQTQWDSFLLDIIPKHELQVFHLSYTANNAVESGQKPMFSYLHTTAGPQMRASYGFGQLTIEAHLDQLGLLTAERLKDLGLTQTQLADMRRRGRATYLWFRLMQGKPIGAAERDAIGLSARLAGNLASLVRSESWIALTGSYGPAFEKSTGIPAMAILDMARTMLLDRREYRVMFRDRYSMLHGEPFRPGARNRSHMAAAAEAVVRVQPDLVPVLRSLGGGVNGAASLGHYLGAGDFSENVHGWYTRAAQSTLGWPKFVELLQRIDPTTTRMRHARDLNTSLAAVEPTGVTGLERAKLAARIARQFHIAPGSAAGWFFVQGDSKKPRHTEIEALRRALDTYLVDVMERQWSDTRLIRALDDVIRKYSAQPPSPPARASLAP